jgi:signal transduction histidine kinase
MKLAEDILNVARIESGSFFLKKERFDICELISEIMNDIEEKIVENKKNIKLFFELHNGNNNDKIIVEADKNRLSQVISNLLNNAIKFTDEGSITVIVGTKKINNNNNSKKVIVSIKDTGTGIDSEILPKLFTKFTTKSAIVGGTGLGLFISKSIIEMHGGSIWAFNNDEKNKADRGSTFTFSLPLKE